MGSAVQGQRSGLSPHRIRLNRPEMSAAGSCMPCAPKGAVRLPSCLKRSVMTRPRHHVHDLIIVVLVIGLFIVVDAGQCCLGFIQCREAHRAFLRA